MSFGCSKQLQGCHKSGKFIAERKIFGVTPTFGLISGHVRALTLISARIWLQLFSGARLGTSVELKFETVPFCDFELAYCRFSF